MLLFCCLMICEVLFSALNTKCFLYIFSTSITFKKRFINVIETENVHTLFHLVGSAFRSKSATKKLNKISFL